MPELQGIPVLPDCWERPECRVSLESAAWKVSEAWLGL